MMRRWNSTVRAGLPLAALVLACTPWAQAMAWQHSTHSNLPSHLSNSQHVQSAPSKPQGSAPAPGPASVPRSEPQPQSNVRPAPLRLPGQNAPNNVHLGTWLDQHRSLTVNEQERQLRSDPSFNRLSSAAQQRVVQQLHQVNELTPEQQQRRAARVEMLEKLTPGERLQVNESQRRWSNLPRERQLVLKKAFHDLGGVPVEQRQMVLNSSRYQGAFSPDERGILSDLLRVEPYHPANQ